MLIEIAQICKTLQAETNAPPHHYFMKLYTYIICLFHRDAFGSLDSVYLFDQMASVRNQDFPTSSLSKSLSFSHKHIHFDLPVETDTLF